VEYYERGGDAVAQVSWTGGTTTPAPTVTALTPIAHRRRRPPHPQRRWSNFVFGASVLWNGRAAPPRSSTPPRHGGDHGRPTSRPRSVPVSVRSDGQTSGTLTFTVIGGRQLSVYSFTAPASGANRERHRLFTVWIEGAAAGSKTTPSAWADDDHQHAHHEQRSGLAGLADTHGRNGAARRTVTVATAPRHRTSIDPLNVAN